jgi:hypothetical protein
MAGILKAVAVGALGKLADVLLRPRTSIGYIIPQVFIGSEGRDELTITDHPIETGAPVSDHAYKQPATLNMTVGWGAGGLLVDFSGTTNSVDDAYAALLDLQNLREPFTVTTSKRIYQNMMIASLGCTTNKETQNVIIIDVGLREVLIVDTQATTLPPKPNQAEPQKTAAPDTEGTKQPTVPKTSALLDAVNAGKSLLKVSL